MRQWWLVKKQKQNNNNKINGKPDYGRYLGYDGSHVRKEYRLTLMSLRPLHPLRSLR